MKYTLTLLAATALISTSAMAQEMGGSTTTTSPSSFSGSLYRPSINKIRFGAFIAPNISWMHPTASKSDDGQFAVKSDGSRLGFTYGLMAEYFFAANYGLVTGLDINSTGGKIVATSTKTTADLVANDVLSSNFTYRLQYLEIPLALKLRTDEIDKFRFFGQLGVSVGVNIGKKADYTVVSEADTLTKPNVTASGDKVKLTGNLGAIAPVMFQMNLGAGAEYPINNKLTAYAGIFFNNGFAPDATNPEKFDHEKLGYKGTFKDGNTRLNNFALRVGLFF